MTSLLKYGLFIETYFPFFFIATVICQEVSQQYDFTEPCLNYVEKIKYVTKS